MNNEAPNPPLDLEPVDPLEVASLEQYEAAPLDVSKATAEMFGALSKAQSKINKVGKDAKNTQRGYKYTSADALVHASRDPLTSCGLAFFSSWEYREAAVVEGSIGNQFVSAHLRTHWVMSHESGGIIRGFADMPAIASPARPPDKAAAAALTYARGFILRDLLNIDRGEETEDDVDRRDESQGWQPNPRRNVQRGGQQRRPEPPREGSRKVTPAKGSGPVQPSDAKAKAQAVLDKAESAHAEQAAREGKPDPKSPEGVARKGMVVEAKKILALGTNIGRKIDIYKIASDAIGKTWNPNVIHSVDEYKAAERELLLERERIETELAKAEQDKAAESVDSNDLPEPEGAP